MTPSSFHEVHTFRQALGLCRRFILPAVISFFLARVEFFGPYDIELDGIHIFSMVSRYFFLCLLILFWAGIYNVLADIVTERSLVMRLSSFISGVRFWPAAAVLFLVSFLAHFCLFLLTGIEGVRVEPLAIILYPFLSVYVVRYVFRRRSLGNRFIPAPLSLLDIGILAIAAVIGLLCELLSTQTVGALWTVIVKFISQTVCLFILYYIFYALSRRAVSDGKKADGKNLVLINPASSGILMGCASLLVRAYPSFFVSLRAFTPGDYRVFELNRVLWLGAYARPGALVAISCYTTNAAEAYAVARKFRDAGSKVVMGGPHAGLFPQEALEFCNAVVVGPAEGVWAKIVADYENGSLNGIYQGSCSCEDLDRVHQYLLGSPPEIALDTLMVTRGCKFRCYFCTHSVILNTEPRRVEDMIALLKHIRSITRTVTFRDSNLFADPVYAKSLLTVMIPLEMKWSSAASLDIARSDEMVALLKESGCQSLLVGYEIADSSQEAARGGKFAMTSEYIKLSRKLKAAGIGISAHFMFGFPTDSWKSLWRLWLFCLRLFPLQTAVSYMSPIPGSPYYDDMVREGKLLDLNWRSYNGHIMVCEHPFLKPVGILREGFICSVVVIFFVTTSRWGIYYLAFAMGGYLILFR